MLFPSARLIGRVVRGKAFSRSGSFETGNDGFILSGGMQRLESVARSGKWAIGESNGSNNNYADLTLSPDVVRSTRITFSAWHRKTGGFDSQDSDGARVLLIKRGGGGFEIVASSAGFTELYQELSATFDHKANEAITFRMGSSVRFFRFDDWSITGTPL